MDRYRTQVRSVAANFDFGTALGEIRVVFDPSQASEEKRDESIGEPVEREWN
jgi:hypothetical protein